MPRATWLIKDKQWHLQQAPYKTKMYICMKRQEDWTLSINNFKKQILKIRNEKS